MMKRKKIIEKALKNRKTSETMRNEHCIMKSNPSVDKHIAYYQGKMDALDEVLKMLERRR